MLNFRNYYLFRENQESNIPSLEDFTKNSFQQLVKLPEEMIRLFAVQCAEKVLPVWENYVKDIDQLGPKQKNGPRLAIDFAKGISKIRPGNSLISNASMAIRNDPASRNAILAASAVSATYQCSYYRNDSYDRLAEAASYVAYTAVDSGGITDEEVYNIFVKLLKAQHIKQHMPDNYHLQPDIIAMIKAAQEHPDNNIMAILADKLQDHDFNNEEILAHLRDPKVQWNKNDWIFKELLK
jgi:hypothetical protein